MYDELEEIIKIHSEIGDILKELKKYETGENPDYMECLAELEWIKETLHMHLKSLKLKEQLNTMGDISDEIM